MAKKKENQTENKTEKVFEITQDLKTKLTIEEQLKAADALAEAVQKLTELEEEKKTIADSYKAKISKVEAEINIQRHLVSNKWEFRPVACEEIYNFEAGTVKVVRLDSEETVIERSMTPEERQGKFDFEEEDAASGVVSDIVEK